MFTSKLNIVSDQQETLLKMEKSEFQFHLTGSRRFGNHSTLSDWDFFTDDNEEVVRFLCDLGFRVYFEDRYNIYPDSQTVVVLRHSAFNIDVQIVKDVETKRMAQDLLLQVVGRFMPRKSHELSSERRDIWDGAYRYINSLKEKMIETLV